MNLKELLQSWLCPDYQVISTLRNKNEVLENKLNSIDIPIWFQSEYAKYPFAKITYCGRPIQGHSDIKPRYDVRSFVCERDYTFEQEIKNINLSYIGENTREIYDNIAYETAKYLAPKIKYVRDQDNFGFNEFWAQPQDTWALKMDDCFSGDTKIICRKDGKYKRIKIKDLKNFEGIEALSYNFKKERFEFKQIKKWWNKGKRKVVKVKLRNGTSFTCTPEHKFFKWKATNHKGFKEQKLSDFDLSKWYERQLLCVRKLPEFDIPSVDVRKLWIYGQYLAEGWKQGNRIYICGDDPEIKEMLCNYLDELNIKYSNSKRKKSSYIEILDKEFKKEFEKLGENAFDKTIKEEVLSDSSFALSWLLEGYELGDSYYPKNKRYKVVHNTSSNKLADDLRFVHWILEKPLYSWLQKNHQGAGNKPIWRLYEDPNTLSNKKTLRDLSKTSIVAIEDTGEKEVFDIEIEDNHNFILAHSGVLAHNCEGSTNLFMSYMIIAGVPYYLLRNCCGLTYSGFGHSTLYYYASDNKWHHIECTLNSYPWNKITDFPLRTDVSDTSNIEHVWFSFDARNSFHKFTTAGIDSFKEIYNNFIIETI